MMDKPWFDQETGTLMLDEYVVEMDSYRRIVKDEAITDAELVEQTQRVTSLLRQLEETLSPEAKMGRKVPLRLPVRLPSEPVQVFSDSFSETV